MRSLPYLVCLAIATGCATELENPEAFGGATGVSGAAGTSGASGAAGTAGMAGSAGTGGTGGTAGSSGAAGTGGGGGSTVCDAPTLVFNVPDTQGGCQGAACHMNVFPPELHSPGVAERLLNQDSTLCPGNVFIDSANPANSYILNKVQQAMPTCGERMPYMPNPALSADKLECLVEWVNSVAAGAP